MILTCPECETQYFAEDSTIGDSGRTVKCATCGHAWFVGPEGADNSPANLAGAHEAYRLKVRERKRQQSRTAALVAWTVTGAIFASILGGLVLFRQQVVELWPQSSTTYAMLGMPVNRFSLEFVAAEPERFFDGTVPILEVRGEVINRSENTVDAPNVRVTLLDDTGADIAQAFTVITPSRIPAQATARFSTRIENPPFESFELDLTFVPADTTLAGTEASAQ